MENYVEDKMVKIVAKVYTAILPAILIVVIAFNLFDFAGTLFYTANKVDGTWVIISSAVIAFALTSVLQYVVTGMCYTAGANAYIASIGAMITVAGMTKKEQRTDNIFVIEYRKVSGKKAGFAWLLLVYPLSLIFDSFTDFTYFKTSPWAAFAWLLAFSSLLNEHLAYILSMAIHTIQDAKEEV